MRAAEYVLGTLEPAAQRRVQAELAGDTRLQAAVARWERLLLALEDEGTEPPPPDLWDRIEKALAQRGTRTVRFDDGEWERLSPGVMRKLLHTDATTGAQSCLVRCDAGASIEAHDHPLAEECLVLEGDLVIDGTRLAANDYQLAAQGTRHVRMHSVGGCLLFVRGTFAA